MASQAETHKSRSGDDEKLLHCAHEEFCSALLRLNLIWFRFIHQKNFLYNFLFKINFIRFHRSLSLALYTDIYGRSESHNDDNNSVMRRNGSSIESTQSL